MESTLSPPASGAAMDAAGPGTTGSEDLRGYDAVAAITQDAFNSQLDALWEDEIIERHIEEEWKSASVDSDLGPPTVELVVRGEKGATQDVILYLNFGKGQLKLNPGRDPVQLDGVQLGFRSAVRSARIDRQMLAASERATAKLRESVAGVDPGCDIESVYISLTETIRPENLYSTRGIDLAAAAVLVELCARHFADADAPVPRLALGYQPVAGAANDPTIPPLVPTLVEHGLTRHPANPGLSTFNFLMMCGGRPAPRPRPYLPTPRVNERGLQGRYLVSELRFFRQGLFGEVQAAMNAPEPAAWDAARGCFVLHGVTPLRHDEKTIDRKRVVIDCVVTADCRFTPVQARPDAPIRFTVDWDVLQRATCTVDGQPMELSPVEIRTTIRNGWTLRQDQRTRLKLTCGQPDQLEYVGNQAANLLYQPAWDTLPPVWRALREACSAFGGGTWPTQRYADFFSGAEVNVNAGAVILPLGKTFFFANLTLAGEINRNLQADLTYRD